MGWSRSLSSNGDSWPYRRVSLSRSWNRSQREGCTGGVGREVGLIQLVPAAVCSAASHSMGSFANNRKSEPGMGAPSSVMETGGEHYQSKLSSFIANSLEVTTQTVMAADRRSMRVSMTPVFNTASDARPIVSNPVIPGGARP